MRKFFKILGIITLCFLLILLSFVMFVVIKSRAWEKEFVASMNSEYIVNHGSVLTDVLNEKIEEYIMSDSDTDFITFYPKEVSQLIYGAIAETVEGSGLIITNIYVEPSLGSWNLCGRFELRDLKNIHLWTCVDISKDNMQTAQLYIKDILVQGFSVGRIFPKVLTLANQGLAEALTTANENGFVGRIFENIELMEDKMVVKGSIF